MTPRVAVVGAGMAGLSCASFLAQAGLEVVILERNGFVGGRMGAWHGDVWQCDHGAQFFTAREAGFHQAVQSWCRAGLASPWTGRFVSFDAAGVAQGLSNVERFVGTPCMDTPLLMIAARLRVMTRQGVIALDGVRGTWELTTRESGRLPEVFDAVVLAVPPTEACNLLHMASPALSVVADRARMRPCWAVMLHYATPPALPFDAAFVNGGPLRWMANDGAKPGRGGRTVWVLHASADWSVRHLSAQPERVAEALIAAFAAFGAGLPDAWTAYLWRDAEAVVEPGSPLRGYVWRESEQLGLCGDWLGSGRVEGAWLSGRGLGAAVLQSLARRPG